MPTETRIVAPGLKPGVVYIDGTLARYPEGWELLPPGDATLTRRVKASGPTWTIQEKKGRRTFSKGVLADAARIRQCREAIQAERATPQYAKRRQADLRRREQKQSDYVEEFESAVADFLNFHARHSQLQRRLARAVAQHATPVGSGTVARTKRIPVQQRAEAAVIAWLRHQTTAYDNMKIARVKGKRREVRRELAERSRMLLQQYRQDGSVPANCPLQAALTKPAK